MPLINLTALSKSTAVILFNCHAFVTKLNSVKFFMGGRNQWFIDVENNR